MTTTGRLFGAVKAKGRTAETSAPVQRVFDRFHDQCLARHGFKPDPRQYGRYGKDVKVLVETWGEDVVLGLVDEFFTSTDPRVLRSDYTLRALLDLATYLRVRDGRVDNERLASNLDAAARASRKRSVRRE